MAAELKVPSFAQPLPAASKMNGDLWLLSIEIHFREGEIFGHGKPSHFHILQAKERNGKLISALFNHAGKNKRKVRGAEISLCENLSFLTDNQTSASSQANTNPKPLQCPCSLPAALAPVQFLLHKSAL